MSTGFLPDRAQREVAPDCAEQAAGGSFAVVAEGLPTGRIEELLECQARQELCRRLAN